MSGRTQPDSSTSGRSSDDATSPRSALGKMILPRLGGHMYEPSSVPKRIAHACERCRALKAKCTGGERCDKCVVDKADCKYGDGKRERNKKEMASQLEKTTSLANQNEYLLAALREVCADENFDQQKHSSVVQLLSQYPTETNLNKKRSHNSEGRYKLKTSNKDGGAATSAGIGSPGAMDKSASMVSLGTGAGASGYIGKGSEISWLQRALEYLSLQQGDFDHALFELERDHPQGSPLDYHMDEANLLAVDEETVDPMEMPPLSVGTELAESYFETVHSSFPLVDREDFMDVLVNRFHIRPPLSWSERRWLSVANIIFAIGAKWMYLTRLQNDDGLEPHIGPGDHIIYYARARSLGLDHRLIMDHPMVEQIQALGILGLYLIVNHQISRAWTTVGHAIRHAIALGLHLRVGSDSSTRQQQRHHSRTWCSLYSLEQLLGDFTGRPTSILDTDVAIPFDMATENKLASKSSQHLPTRQGAPSNRPPAVIKDVPYSPSLYFANRIRLNIIGHKIRSSLYSSGLPGWSWSRIQQSIRTHDRELIQWSADLPENLKIPEGVDLLSPDRQGELLSRFELAMSYQSVRMILFRPSLFHMEAGTVHESNFSQSFNQQAALSCILAARTLLDLLPDNAAITHASKCLPCWSLLHYITQAGAVIILELSLKAVHMPKQVDQLSKDLTKVVGWLAEMASDSLSAWRSWKICCRLALQAAAAMGIDIIVPGNVQQPPGWQPAYDQLLSRTLSVSLDEMLPMDGLDHFQQQSEVPFTTKSASLFPIDAEMTESLEDGSSERQIYPRQPPGQMDWKF